MRWRRSDALERKVSGGWSAGTEERKVSGGWSAGTKEHKVSGGSAVGTEKRRGSGGWTTGANGLRWPVPNEPWKRSLLISVLVAVCCLLAWFPLADDAGSAHVDDAFKRALVAFALARGLNGVISVAQGTEVAVQPAGVGVNFTPGEILDPINDLVERFSWVMMLASSSLGVQKILLAMSAWQGVFMALTVTGLLWLANSWWSKSPPWLGRAFGRVFLFLLILRFMMPAVAIANDWVYQTFLERDYIEASESLANARERIGNINDQMLDEQEPEETTGLFDRARSIYRGILDSVNVSQKMAEYRLAAESISENTIRLIVVFLMQTVVFPLLFLYVILGVVKRLTRNR